MGHLIHTDGLVKATVMIICLALVQSAIFIGKSGKKRLKRYNPRHGGIVVVVASMFRFTSLVNGSVINIVRGHTITSRPVSRTWTVLNFLQQITSKNEI